MAVIKSTTRQSAGEELIIEFEGVEGKSAKLNSDESAEVLELLARAHFMEAGADSVSVEFSVPLCDARIGERVRVIAPDFGVPSVEGGDSFVVTSVAHEFSENSAITKIKAVQYIY
ncbi:MAG: hypothetical protein J6M14_02760 [Campylobacter sp.]|nr:hypothetical protein [Campylobacter sp.]